MEPTIVPASTGPARLWGLPSWLLTQAGANAGRLVREGFVAAGATGYQYRLLATLGELGPLSQAELGRRSGIDRSDVVATVNELAGAGHVERTPDPDDRRRNTITLTAAGRRQLQKLDRQVAKVQDTLLEPLTGAERTQLVALLTRLVGSGVPDPE